MYPFICMYVCNPTHKYFCCDISDITAKIFMGRVAHALSLASYLSHDSSPAVFIPGNHSNNRSTVFPPLHTFDIVVHNYNMEEGTIVLHNIMFTVHYCHHLNYEDLAIIIVIRWDKY